MAGFHKAKSEQAALKVAIFGPAGSGKTFTSLLIAEGLAKLDGKKVAYWDTEHGTDFYAQAVPNRQFHPEAFEFEAIYTRSLTEGNADVFGLDPAEYGVVVIDSMTHLWEAAIASYTGSRPGGKIPMHAWGKIKAPYKALMQWMINTPMHVFLLGRQAYEWGQDDDSGETVAAGVKMKAEGETAYEPHLLLRMEGVKPLRDDGKSVKKNAVAVPTMYVIKDRTGILQGHTIPYPGFETVALPLLGLLGKTQAQIPTEDESVATDVENLRRAEQDKAVKSDELRRKYLARFELARGKPEKIEAIVKELTPALKKQIRNVDLQAIRECYLACKDGVPQAPVNPDGDPSTDEPPV